MTDDEYSVLFELRKIPQRASNYMILRGASAMIAKALVYQGLAVPFCTAEGDDCFRLNRAGRKALSEEFARRKGEIPQAP